VLDERIKCWAREEGSKVCPALRTEKPPPPSLAHPSPLGKTGTFYLAKKRNFLLCVDIAVIVKRLSNQSAETLGPWNRRFISV